MMTGIVVGSGAGAAETRALKPIADVLDDGPFLPDAVVDLALWTAEYYACGPGETLAGAMPPSAWIESERHVRITEAGARAPMALGTPRARVLAALRNGRAVPVRSLVSALRRRAEGLNALVNALAREGLVDVSQPLRGRADASKTVRVASATAAGFDAAGLRLGARQREALAVLAGAPEGVDVPVLTARGIDQVTLKRLADRGLVSIARRKVDRGAQGCSGCSGCRGNRALGQSAACSRPSERAGERGTLPVHAAPWRHGKRQDRDLRSPRRAHRLGREAGPDARARDCAHVRGGGAIQARVRRAGRDSAQRTVRRRAARSVDQDPGRRDRRRRGHAVGGLCADRPAGPHRRRRRARQLIQAGRDPALPRA